MKQGTPEREKQLRKQKGYQDTMKDLMFIKNSTPLEIYTAFCRSRRTWSQKEGESVAIKDFKSLEETQKLQ